MWLQLRVLRNKPAFSFFNRFRTTRIISRVTFGAALRCSVLSKLLAKETRRQFFREISACDEVPIDRHNLVGLIRGMILPSLDCNSVKDKAAIFTLLVIKYCLRQLLERGGRKAILSHFLSEERRSRRADGPSTVSNSPRSTASIRSSDSAAHFASMSLTRASSRLPTEYRSTSRDQSN
jgi:hypothetical protein